ncbi:hypothetical protein [Pseudobdellovibrio sp. HCB154]|uniref:hypothetical protein n=1 Tax=Pseudobdellovibrio sp. HCB154 TaxID=3386277 RepID=UPI003916FAE3
MSARVILNFSPHVESDILSQTNLDNLGRSLIQVKKLFGDLRFSFALIIPKELMQSFYGNSYLRIFIESVLEDTQSNILFESTVKSADCMTADVSTQFVNIQNIIYTPVQIINDYINQKTPLLFDNLIRQVQKDNCATCTGRYMCGDVRDIATTDLTVGNLVANIATLNADNYAELKRKNTGWDLLDIRKFALFEAFNQGVDMTLLRFANDIEISKSCLSEIRGLGAVEIVEIAFSMFRSLAYVSSKKADRCHFSIDYHPETIMSKHQGFHIERCDVIEPHKAGNSASGTKRLLRLVKDQVITFAAYVSTHDFNEDLIKSRIKSITNSN